MTATLVNPTENGRQVLVAADRQPKGRRCQQQQQQRSRSVATAVATGLAAVAVAGFPRADAFFAAPQTTTPCLVGGAGLGGVGSTASGVCRRYGERGRVARMSSEEGAGGEGHSTFQPPLDTTEREALFHVFLLNEQAKRFRKIRVCVALFIIFGLEEGAMSPAT